MLKKAWAGLLLLALLLSGCGSGAAPEAAQSPARETAKEDTQTWAEPDAVDDSYTYDYEWQVSCDCDTDYEHLKKHVLPAYIDRWTEGGELLDMEVQLISGSGSGRDVGFGWICFTGTPKTETGWQQTEYQGKPCFCRSFVMTGTQEESGALHAAVQKSFAMAPEKMLRSYEIDETGAYLPLPKRLPELASAELYVPQLGQSFAMTDPAALSSLREALSEKPEYLRSMSADITEQESFNPLYLRFADGSGALVLAAGDGADCCLVWELGDSFGPVSEFERFGVPLPSPGYTKNADGSTVLEQCTEGTDRALGQSFRHLYRSTFDAQGRLILTEHEFHREDRDESTRRDFFYREDGKIERIEEENSSPENPSWHNTTTFEYNEQGLLVRQASFSPAGTMFQTPTGAIELTGFYYEFRYDELGRLTARIYHYWDGREGMPGGNAYYWYDEQGRQHVYGVDEEGNLVGGPENDAGDRPIRR